MQAIVNTKYGPAELTEIEVPTLEPGQVLVRVRAASLNALDWRLMRGLPYAGRAAMGLRGPKATVRGADLAGVVETVAEGVTDLARGDEVFGRGLGTFAELCAASADALAPKPTGLTFEEAAAIPVAGATALQALRDRANVQPGQHVLVNGAAGGVGTFTVQIAKALGATVTAVCSTQNLEQARTLGADHVVDYTVEDFSRNGTRYDAIMDSAGSRSLRTLRRSLTPDGTLVVVGGHGGSFVGPIGPMLGAIVLNRFVGQTLLPLIASIGTDDLVVLTQLVEEGKLRPAVERTYSLAEAPDALGYIETGHARAKLVLSI
jgi:NADPH:quinone reductase-like Zn-dependent oxidoreductase